MSAPPEENVEAKTPTKTSGFLTRVFGFPTPFSTKKSSQDVARSTNRTSAVADQPSQTPTSNTLDNGITAHADADLIDLNGTGQNAVSFRTKTATSEGRITQATTTARDLISGTPFGKQGTAIGASTPTVDFPSPQDPTALNTAFNAVAQTTSTANNGRASSAWGDQYMNSSFSIGSHSRDRTPRTESRVRAKSSSLRSIPMTIPTNRFRSLMASIDIQQRKQTEDKTQLTRWISQAGSLFDLPPSSKKRKQADETSQVIVAQRGTEHRNTSRLAFRGTANDDEGDDSAMKRATKKQKKNVHFGVDDGDNDNAPLVGGFSTPRNGRLPKRKGTPYNKTTAFDDGGEDDDDDLEMKSSSAPNSSGRRMLKANLNNPKSPLALQDHKFEEKPEVNLIVLENQPFSSESEREDLNQNAPVDTGFHPPVSLIYSQDIPDPSPGSYAGVPMPLFDQEPLPERKKKKTVDHGDNDSHDAKRFKAAPDWKCVHCQTMNPDDESACKACKTYRAADPVLKEQGWGNAFIALKGKWICQMCTSPNDAMENKQCQNCGAWVCPNCNKSNEMSVTICSLSKSEKEQMEKSKKKLDEGCGNTKPAWVSYEIKGLNMSESSAAPGGSTKVTPSAKDSGAIGPDGFRFGGGISFGQAASNSGSSPAPATVGFSFGGATTPLFGSQPSSTSASASTAPAGGGFAFPGTSSGGFSFGSQPASAPASAGAFSSGASSAQTSSAPSAPIFGNISGTPKAAPENPFGASTTTPLSDTDRPKFAIPSLHVPPAASSSEQKPTSSTEPKQGATNPETTGATNTPQSIQQGFQATANNSNSAPAFSFGGGFSSTTPTPAPSSFSLPGTTSFSSGLGDGSSQSNKRRNRDDDAQADQPTTFGAFGSSTANAPPQPNMFGNISTGGSLFGASGEPSTSNNSSGADAADKSSDAKNEQNVSNAGSSAPVFGSTNSAPSSGNFFSSTPTPAQAPALSTSSSLFGSAAAPAQAPGPSSNTGLFGSATASAPTSNGVMFGTTAGPTQASAPSSNGGLFGTASAPPANGVSFDAASASAPQNAPAFGAFGQAPAPAQASGPSGSLFGSSTSEAQSQTPVAPSFGSAPASSQEPSSNATSFGTTPSFATGGLFGSTPAPGGATFGGTTEPPAAGVALFGGPSFGATSAPAPQGLGMHSGQFGSTPAPAPFGSNTANAPVPGGFGSTAPTPAPFGSSAPAPFGSIGAPAAPSFNGFGGNNPTPSFGDTSNPAPFGNNQTGGAPSFGAASGVGFGQQPAAQPQQPMSSFGGFDAGASGGGFSMGSSGAGAGSRTGPRRRIVKAKRPPRPG